LERATTRYQEQLPVGDFYLSARGITPSIAAQARLGVVVSPEPGHEQYAGRLVIPYLDKVGVYGLKFRCMAHTDCAAEGCTKYLALPGQEIGVYNVVDTDSTDTTIHVAEGELDTLILKQVFDGQPCVGIPGVQLWKVHHPFHFGGFERVLIWADGDKAGQDLANRIRKDVRNSEVVPIPKGFDVTDLFLAQGAEIMRGMVGLDEDDE
jgi:hypothetical protein